MARKPRIEQAGGIYWVTGRCVEGTRLSPSERGLFLGFLEHTVARHRWMCAGYAILENGYELVLTVPEANLSRGMRDLNGEFTQALNRARGRSGPVFRGRFKAAAVERGAPFLEVCRAVALSPVRSGLCSKPGKWAHSSYAALAGEAGGPAFLADDWVADHFGGKPKKARARFEKFVRSGVAPDAPAVKQGLFVGSDAFGEKLQNAPKGSRRPRAATARPSLGHLFPKASAAEGARRDAKIAEARIVHGYTLAQIAGATGLHPATISRIARKKESESQRAGVKIESASQRGSESARKKKKKKGK